MDKTTVKFEGGSVYELQFPSIGRVKKLQELVGVDLFGGVGELKNIKVADVLGSNEKALKVLDCCLVGVNHETVLNEMTPGDFELVLSAFFLTSKNASGEVEGVLSVLKDFIGMGGVIKHQKDMLLTSQSSMPATELRTE